MVRPVLDLRARASAVAMLAAVELLVAAAATELAAAIGFAMGRALSPAALAVGCVAALAMGAVESRRVGLRAAVIATLVAVVVAAVALPLAGAVYDVSWDGQAYQQSGVLAIAEGWNPFGPPLPVPRPYTTPYWVNHYAKGPWIRAAALLLATDHVEVAKAWNFILAAAAGLASAGALLRIRSLPAPFAVAGAVLAALNPVLPPQMFTFYVDGQLASVVTALVAMVAGTIAMPGPLPLAGLAAAFLLLPGIKLTGVAYAFLFAVLAALAIAWLARWRWRGAALAVALGAVAGVLVTGWNPYVTNLVRAGNPLYPVAGNPEFDVLYGQAPPEFLARSRLEKLAIATFSASRNGNDVKPTLKWPFTWKGDETTLFQHPDARYGGFGPLFSGALVLSVLTLASASPRRSRRAMLLAGAVSAALLATVLMNPEPWWARYVPQLWLVPLVIALGAAAAPGRLPVIAATLTFATMTADCAVVTINATHRVRKKSADVAAQLTELSREPAPIAVSFGFESNGRRLREAGVPFVERDPLPCSAPETLAHSQTRFCRAAAPTDLPPR